MKKVILLFLILLVVPFASAIISVDGPDRTKYNKGDEVPISGYIFRDEATAGLILFTLSCDGIETQALSIPISLEAGEKKRFPEDMAIPKIIVPRDMEGTCFINAALVSNGAIIEEDKSDIFIITTDLDGSFQIDKTQVQVGRTLILTGTIFKLDGEDIDGSIELYLKLENSSYFVNIINIQNGKFEYSYTTIPSTPGRYSIDLKVRDTYGNNKLFENVASFNLVDELYVFAKPDTVNVMPGEKVIIAGESKTILLENLARASVKIKLGDNLYTTELMDSKFSYELMLPEDIKTGKHTIFITINDDVGNWGSTDTTIYVQAVPSKLELEFDEKMLKPDETLEVVPQVYDQANDPYLEDVNIEVKDTKGNLIFSDIVKSAEKFIFKLPSASLPGSWSITGYAAGLSAEDNVDVEQLVAADVALVNQTLYIKNTGNVDYKKPVKIEFNNGEYALVRRVSLAPNEVTGLYLYEEVPSGQYDIKVIYGDDEKEFDDIVIVGKAKKSFNKLYWLLIGVLVAIFVYLAISKRPSIPKHIIRKEKIPVPKAVRKKAENFNKEESIKSFRERILKDIKKTEEQQKPKDKGLFNMFG